MDCFWHWDLHVHGLGVVGSTTFVAGITAIVSVAWVGVMSGASVSIVVLGVGTDADYCRWYNWIFWFCSLWTV